MVFFCFWRVGGGIETEEEGLGKATVVKGFFIVRRQRRKTGKEKEDK